MFKPVIDYDAYRRNQVENKHPEGFWFDMDMFENLIDAWTPKEDVCTILQATHQELDAFCKECYGYDFDRTYSILKAISMMGMRKSVSTLAKAGNSSALVIAAKNFAELNDGGNDGQINITFKNDLPKD